MFQSQLISVNITDNEKKRKNENIHKELSKNCVHISRRGMTITRSLPAISTNKFGENMIC